MGGFILDKVSNGDDRTCHHLTHRMDEEPSLGNGSVMKELAHLQSDSGTRLAIGGTAGEVTELS